MDSILIPILGVLFMVMLLVISYLAKRAGRWSVLRTPKPITAERLARRIRRNVLSSPGLEYAVTGYRMVRLTWELEDPHLELVEKQQLADEWTAITVSHWEAICEGRLRKVSGVLPRRYEIVPSTAVSAK